MENEVVAKRTIGERLFALAQDFGKLLKTKKFWWELFIMTAGMFVAGSSRCKNLSSPQRLPEQGKSSPIRGSTYFALCSS